MTTLVLLRHGQSLWNKQNLFTGWVDVPLTQAGIDEAMQAGKTMQHIHFDAVYMSTLMRAQQTAMLSLLPSTKTPRVIHDDPLIHEKETIYAPKSQENTIPVYIDQRLNERYYGELQGNNKQDMADKYGKEQVHTWRRSFDVPPPRGESLKMTAERTLPCFNERIMPDIQQGKNVLVVAHGNSLRSIVMAIENLSKEAVLSLELPTGLPRAYQWQDNALSPVALH